jgi:hypothetical protein
MMHIQELEKSAYQCKSKELVLTVVAKSLNRLLHHLLLQTNQLFPADGWLRE